MKQSKTVYCGIYNGNLYVSISGKKVTTIQTIGEYDCIHTRDFDTEDEAKKFYDSFGN